MRACACVCSHVTDHTAPRSKVVDETMHLYQHLFALTFSQVLKGDAVRARVTRC
jgi:hypothetical protein